MGQGPTRGAYRWLTGTGILLGLALSACTSPTTTAPTPGPAAPPPPSVSAAPPDTSPPAISPPGTATAQPTSPTPTGPTGATPTPTPAPAFDARAVLADIERLAVDIGPREATSDNFDEAADLVERRLAGHGYDVATEPVRVPAGNSWGTRVPAGTSRNVVADPEDFDATAPHVVVVAHLDTVPIAPGAEDNASGVAVLLELARMAAVAPPRLPIRFIAFGAEEPRGSGDALHHFGSQQHVADLGAAERDAIEAVVALDRVGVRAPAVPVCSARASGNRLRAAVRDAADDVDIPTRACGGNTASDHWSFAKAGLPAIRLGSVPYAGYHSPDDTPDVVDRRQLDRVGRIMWAWLQDP